MTVTSSPTTHTAQVRIAGWLTPEEFSILEAACDTFFPSLDPPSGSSEALAAFYRRKASDLHVALLLAETLSYENAQSQTQFRQLLALMASPASGLLLVGSLKSFTALSLAQREKYLLAMANSPISTLRQGYQSIKRLAGFIFFSVPDEQGVNPNWEVMD